MQSRSVTLSDEFVYVSRQTAALGCKLLHPFDLLRARNIIIIKVNASILEFDDDEIVIDRITSYSRIATKSFVTDQSNFIQRIAHSDWETSDEKEAWANNLFSAKN
jgi:hypothetical protein